MFEKYGTFINSNGILSSKFEGVGNLIVRSLPTNFFMLKEILKEIGAILKGEKELIRVEYDHNLNLEIGKDDCMVFFRNDFEDDFNDEILVGKISSNDLFQILEKSLNIIRSDYWTQKLQDIESIMEVLHKIESSFKSELFSIKISENAIFISLNKINEQSDIMLNILKTYNLTLDDKVVKIKKNMQYSSIEPIEFNFDSEIKKRLLKYFIDDIPMWYKQKVMIERIEGVLYYNVV